MAEKDTVSQSLIKFLGALDNPKRTGEADTGSYGYTYPELDKILADIRPIALKHGFAIQQDTVTKRDEDGIKTIGVKTILEHDSGGRKESSWLSLPIANGAQANGSLITYLKRYSLTAFLGISGEDDDGAEATAKSTQRKPQKPVGNTPTPSDAPPPEKKERTPGGASFKSLGLARGLFVQRGIALGPADGETPEVTDVRREQNCMAISDWLKDRGFEQTPHDDELLFMNQVRLSQVIDKVKAEIAETEKAETA